MGKKPVTDNRGRKVKKAVKQKPRPDRVAQALKEAGFDCETVLNNVSDGVAILDDQGYVVFQNAVSRQRTGMPFDGLHFSEIVREFDVERARSYFEKALNGEHLSPVPFTYARPDGEELTVEFTTRPILKDGKATALISVSRDLTEHKRIEAALLKGEEKYRTLVEQSLQGMAIAQGVPPRIVFANQALAEVLGYSIGELTSLDDGGVAGLVHSDYRDMFFGRYKDRIQGKPTEPRYEIVAVRKDGSECWVEMCANRIEYHGKPAVQAVFKDITEEKMAHQALQRAHHELENRVRERTAELEEVNQALRVLLRQRDRDRSQLEDKVILNVRELVVPYAAKLRTMLSEDKLIAYLNVLESNLNDIISPFAHKLSSRYSSLTPMEIRTAQFIKDGRTTKEIADLLSLSPRTVESHRKNIRTKMGLHGKKVNLRSYLLSI